VGREDLSLGGCQAAQARMRDIEAIDSELRLVAFKGYDLTVGNAGAG
jgi:hypothetical protein